MNSLRNNISIQTASVAYAIGCVRLSGRGCGATSFIRADWHSVDGMSGKFETNPTLKTEANRTALVP